MKLNVYITEFSFDFIRAHTKYKDALFSVRVSYQDVPSWLTLVGLLKEKKGQIFSAIHTDKNLTTKTC